MLVGSVRHETCATRDACAKNTNVTAAKATYVASAEAAAHVAAATTAAASGLRTRYKKASGKHRACQQHYHSSCHDILH
jgi:hypothetical protein